MNTAVELRDRVETFGWLAEFKTDDELLAACRAAYASGYRRMNAYAPYLVHGLAEAVGFRRSWVSVVTLAGGVLGGIAGFGLQYWTSAVDYPLDIGGRPLNSWPSFVPITFEAIILGASAAAVLGMLALNRLPEPWHPLFNVPAFDRASQDRFFLSIRSDDSQFDVERTRAFLEGLNPHAIHDVPPLPVKVDAR
ncbi:MAG: DUF3341 domain-containing protein [Planctomycetaceae bacterium]|nr:DUF3341 domain-containing protein [Planctomycetaceae bacterium]